MGAAHGIFRVLSAAMFRTGQRTRGLTTSCESQPPQGSQFLATIGCGFVRWRGEMLREFQGFTATGAHETLLGLAGKGWLGEE